MPVSLLFYLKHHCMYSYNTLFGKFVQINCPDISKSKSWFPDKNNLFVCLAGHNAGKFTGHNGSKFKGLNASKRAVHNRSKCAGHNARKCAGHNASECIGHNASKCAGHIANKCGTVRSEEIEPALLIEKKYKLN